ncbi:terminase large subunit [Latilactobacillus phage TMW 1.46 P2]|uniref:terminase TerL endonuclease subunit n=1 Tax=Latilactobacillus sakei TaxID=1599 RepID=UPI002072F417|nr:terminase TerL endonuclease subunit [Latilactobacillus sakei]USF96418.1 terminase [Latilactobacillus sakei]WAX24003.1 terminase large subunit [Latilactobacillus phage TMW 1.46 P2]
MIHQKYVDEYIKLYRDGKIILNKERIMLIDYLERYVLSNDDLYFDEEKIENSVKFTEKWFFKTTAYQRFLNAFVFLYDSTIDDVYYDEFLIIMGRGAGKNGWISSLGAFLISPLNGIEGYDGSIVANSEDQAKTSIKEIYNVIKKNDRLALDFNATKSAITGVKTNSTLVYQTSNGKTKDGLRDGFDVFDEIHMYVDDSGVGVYESGLGKIRESRQFEVGSDGYVRDGYLDEKKAVALQVLKGEIPPNTMFPWWCKLDNEDDVSDRDKWEQANPMLSKPLTSYGKTLFRKIEKQFIKLQAQPSGREEFMTKRMDLPQVKLESSVAPYEQIKATNEPLPDFTGNEVIGAVDFASIRDFAACGITGKKDGKFVHLSHQFARKQFVDKYYGYSLNEEDRKQFRNVPPIRKWEQMGLITIIDAPTISPSVVVDWFTKIREDYALKMVVIDNYRADLLRKSFAEEDIDIWPISNPTAIDGLLAPRIIDGLASNKFIWGDNPLLRWNTQNVLVKTDARGNKQYLKKDEVRRKTDGFKAFEYTLYKIDEIEDIDISDALNNFAALDF